MMKPDPEFDIASGVWIALKRDLMLAMRSKGEVLQALVFFVMVVSLFPLAIGPDTHLLTRIAPGVIWVAALLSVLLTLPRLFASDYADGTLEQFLISPYSLAALAAGKILAHWLTNGVLLALITPLLAIQFSLQPNELTVMVASLILGTPILSMLGAIGAALTLGLRGGAVLTALLVLPLFVPVLIFGAGAIESSMAGFPYEANLYLLGAALLLGSLAAPFAVAAALRISMD